jgi:uncharacterized protein (TIGR00369 family)
VSADDSKRRRIVEWDDPTIGPRAARALSGMQYLEAMHSGELPPPPITRLVGFAFEALAEGRVVFAFTPGEEHANPMAGTHGGVLTTVLDSAMGCAIATKLAVGQGYTTLELKINFVRPVTHATGRLLGEGRIVHMGTKTATAEGFLRDAEGKLYAHATTTCLLFGAQSGG